MNDPPTRLAAFPEIVSRVLTFATGHDSYHLRLVSHSTKNLVDSILCAHLRIHIYAQPVGRKHKLEEWALLQRGQLRLLPGEPAPVPNDEADCWRLSLKANIDDATTKTKGKNTDVDHRIPGLKWFSPTHQLASPSEFAECLALIKTHTKSVHYHYKSRDCSRFFLRDRDLFNTIAGIQDLLIYPEVHNLPLLVASSITLFTPSGVNPYVLDASTIPVTAKSLVIGIRLTPHIGVIGAKNYDGKEWGFWHEDGNYYRLKAGAEHPTTKIKTGFKATKGWAKQDGAMDIDTEQQTVNSKVPAAYELSPPLIPVPIDLPPRSHALKTVTIHLQYEFTSRIYEEGKCRLFDGLVDTIATRLDLDWTILGVGDHRFHCMWVGQYDPLSVRALDTRLRLAIKDTVRANPEISALYTAAELNAAVQRIRMIPSHLIPSDIRKIQWLDPSLPNNGR
ncbi:uncharacterized protein LOC62_07G008830 [Vanrija pseudolonga]|uniref:F-box domain-containing protein n=1 Tax=Vanrija pseudolonga TaxID=143232 RepID=A0AAF0YEM7_9TREE|nr:hypothetical protein LOC62_07G008830 [Vanrija pseudolonga]